MKKITYLLNLFIIILLVFIISISIFLRIKYQQIYNEGVSLLNEGNYEAAIERFNDIPNYENYYNTRELLQDYCQFCPNCGKMIK